MSDDKPSLIRVAPGAKLKNSTVSDNTIVGDGNLINSHGSIEDSEIERNKLYAGGCTYADREYDPYFMPLPPDEKFRRVKAVSRWLKEHVLASVVSVVIATFLTTILVFYTTQWLTKHQASPPQNTTKTAPP